MLEVPILQCNDIERAAELVHRDGFAAVANPLTSQQFAMIKGAVDRVIAAQTSVMTKQDANRGFARYSVSDSLLRTSEWLALIDLPMIERILKCIFGSDDYTLNGGGSDYSLPGAEIQKLHADIDEFFHDPLGQVTFRHVPAPYITVNITLVDFTKENGAIRIVPGTHRSHAAIPTVEQEPQWMRNSIICVPANTAIVRDVRCWHGGTANQSQRIRHMVNYAYRAPWRRARQEPIIPRATFQSLSPRARQLASLLAGD